MKKIRGDQECPKVASECPEKREEFVQDISRLLRVL